MSVEVVTPSHPQYWQYRDTHSARGAPAEVLLPSTAAEVAACLQRAGHRGAAISVRSGGHGTARPATNEGGTVIDLRRMHAVVLPEAPSGRVHLGAGARIGDAVAALGRRGLALSTGDAGDVGVGGTVVAGGIGLLGRASGLFIDRIEALELVTPEGAVVTLSRDAHPDAFAAALGGEPFGVITEVAVRPIELPAVQHVLLLQQPTDVPVFLERWAQSAREAPREVTAFGYLFVSDGTLSAQTTIVIARTDGDAAAVDRFAELAPVRVRQQRSVRYADIVSCSGAPLLAEHAEHARTALLERGDARSWRGLASLLLDGVATKLELRALGGAIGDTPVLATAFRQRNAGLLVRALAPGEDPRRADALDAAWAPITAASLGHYAGLESPLRGTGGPAGTALPQRPRS